jgi:hypothetical protein
MARCARNVENLAGYAVPGPNNRGWVSCNPDVPGSTSDLNRLAAEAIWDRERKCWVRKEANKKFPSASRDRENPVIAERRRTVEKAIRSEKVLTNEKAVPLLVRPSSDPNGS